MTHPQTLLAARLLALAFLLALTGSAAVDKVVDRAGNKGYLDGFFAKTFLKGQVDLLLSTITLLFIGSALALAGGMVQLALGKGSWLGSLGALLTALTMLCLFTGQQLAKDNTGGTTVLPHFALALGALLLCSV